MMSIWKTSSVLPSHQYIVRAHISELMVSINLKTIQPRQARSNEITHIKNAINNLNDFLSLYQNFL